MAIVKGPIFEGRARKEGEPVCEVRKGLKDERIRRRGRFDVVSEGEVEGLDKDWFRHDRSINIIQGGVDKVTAREGISWGHLGTREDFPNYIKILEEQGPAGLVLRQFAGVFDIGEVFVVSDDGNRMGGSLDVLFPFLQCEDSGKEFTIIDVIVSFSGNKCFGEISTRMWVAIEIVLEKDSSGGEQGSIGHNGKGAGYIRDAKTGPEEKAARRVSKAFC